MNQIICFPVHRQRGEIIRCASNLDRLHGEMASTYWKREMQSLSDRLRATGATDAEISKEALLFTGAVMEELQRAYAERAMVTADR